MSDHKIFYTLDKFNRKTSVIQFILFVCGMILFVYNNTLSTLLLELLWKLFRPTETEVERFSFNYIVAIMIVPFFLVKLLFTVIAIIKHFLNKLLHPSFIQTANFLMGRQR